MSKPETREDLIKEVKRLAAIGLTVKQIARVLEVSDRWLYKRKASDPELDAAYQEGRDEGLSFAAGQLRAKIEEGNLTAIIFYLKTQGRWSEKQKVEHTGAAGGPIRVTTHPGDVARAILLARRKEELASANGE